MKLRVLRHVDGNIVGLAGTEPKVPGFPEWLDNEHPRHSFLSEEIAQRTQEFGIADDSQILKRFESLAEAEKARDSAKLSFGIELDEDRKNDGSTPENPRADGSYGYPQAQ